MKAKVEELKSLISTREIKGSEIIIQADALEHQIYREIDALLQQGDENAFACLDQNAEVLQSNAGLLYDIHSIYYQLPYLFFTTIDKSLIPEKWEKTDVEFMHEQFQFFTKKCLKFRGHDSKQEAHFLVLVRQLISRPAGQSLIVQLNQFTQTTGFTILVSGFPKAAFQVIALPKESKDEIYHSAELHYPADFHSIQTLDVYAKLNFGKTHSMVFQPTFIALGHELIHVLHICQRDFRLKTPIPAPYDHRFISGLFGKNFEELTTIDLGKLSENSLRTEHGINQRFSHIRITGSVSEGIDITEAKEIRATILAHLETNLTAAEFANFSEEKAKPAGSVTQTMALSTNSYSSWSSSSLFPKPDDSRVPLLADEEGQQTKCACSCLIL